MRHEAATIIRDEHRSLGAVVHAMQFLVREIRGKGHAPDYRLLHAMLYYIREFPERLHHPKEDRFLFARLGKRSSDARALIEDLKSEHVQGARLIRELERAFVFFEERWPQGGREFLAAVDDYAEFHWAHMRKEEQQLLPLAERHLKPEDWEAIDNAFAGNTDPLQSVKERDFDSLLSRIANLAPAPVGLADPWKKAKPGARD